MSSISIPPLWEVPGSVKVLSVLFFKKNKMNSIFDNTNSKGGTKDVFRLSLSKNGTSEYFLK